MPMLTMVSAMAMSDSKMRSNARFLSDRMAYELDLTPTQYDDCFEVNYDFLYNVDPILDDVVRGYYEAIDEYYTYLDYRNEDLRYILSDSQYDKFVASDYFYRPVYSTGSTWSLRVYTIYSNHAFFYYDAPRHYKTYAGLHNRKKLSAPFYMDRHKNITHKAQPVKIHGNDKFADHRKNDFGTNLRKKDDKNVPNNYSNKNQTNRAKDARYKDNSGNKQAPAINDRPKTDNAPKSGSAKPAASSPSKTSAKPANSARSSSSVRGSAGSSSTRSSSSTNTSTGRKTR